MECAVVRVAQAEVGQPLVLLDEAIANDLDLWLVGNGFEIGVEDGALGVERLSVTVGAASFRVEALGDLVLGLG
jgi:hypothetical protein